MALVGLLGLLFFVHFVIKLVEGIQRRNSVNRLRKERRERYFNLLEEGREKEAYEEFHTRKKKYTSHPDFCDCVKCSVKRFF